MTIKNLICKIRGHDYRERLLENKMVRVCKRCGHVIKGWKNIW